MEEEEDACYCCVSHLMDDSGGWVGSGSGGAGGRALISLKKRIWMGEIKMLQMAEQAE